ncbi:MAG: hypothetical protein OYL97_00210 [Candidatus Poribacteria bacterium]|nr:hypothetical protein [Candidatus Poribacteria bacterium]
MTKSKRFVAFVIFPLLFLSLIILGLLSSGISQSSSRSEGHNVHPTGHLTVDTEFGTINIETTDRNHVDIAIKKIWRSRVLIMRPKLVGWRDELFEDFETTIEYEGLDTHTQSNIRVVGKFKRGREYWQEELKWFKVEIQATVPRQYNVTLKTASRGDIHVGDLTGTVKAEALGGNIYLGKIQDEVWGETGVSGNITLKGCQSSVNLTAATGDIRAKMTMQPQHPWTLQALLGGTIDVTLGPHIAIDIDAQTQGKISSDFSLQPQDEITENLLKGTLNGGGPLLKLHASTGEIRLK